MSYSERTKVPTYALSVNLLPDRVTCKRCGEASGSRGDSHLHGPLRHHFRPSLRHKASPEACRTFLMIGYRHSRLHSKLAGRACKRYGDHGPNVSAIVHDHFPEGIKALLRDHALAASNWINASYVLWTLSGRRRETWLRLKEQVISEHGRGFYG